MATAPQYAATPKVGMAQISTANTNRDGTGVMGNVFNAGVYGSRIDEVIVKSVSSTTIGMVRLYLSDGTVTNLLSEISISAITVSDSVKSFEDGVKLEIVIPTGQSLLSSTSKAELFNVIAFGGDF